MDILRVFNNNVVLARDGDQEVILTGRGLGFKAKPGQRVDDSKVVRKFVPSDGRDPDHVAELLADIPPETIRLVTDAMRAQRAVEARLHVREETPFFTGPRVALSAWIANHAHAAP